MDWMSKVLSGTKDLLKCKDHVLVGMCGRKDYICGRAAAKRRLQCDSYG